MHISKLDAARGQLETAVRLFFANGDSVSIHTLSGAARSLLRDLSRREKVEAGLEAMFKAMIRPERLDEVQGMLVEAQNFFKHANRDADKVLSFNPATTEILLWDAGVLYESLTQHRVPMLLVFRVWFALAHPNILLPEVQRQIAGMATTFDTGDRLRFLGDMLPAAEEFCAGGAPIRSLAP